MFTLTEDQFEIACTVREFAEEHLAPQANSWDEEKHFPIDTMRKAAELGMGGINVREDVGGSGLSRLDGVLVFEALAEGCPAVAAYMSIHNMAAWMIDVYGDQAQRNRYLPDLCSMQATASYCLTEPDAGSDAAALTTRAVRDGDHYVVDGVKQFISGAGSSDVYIVMVRTGGPGAHGITALLVDRDTPGLSFGPNERKMGWNAQPTRQVVLDNARVPVGNRLGPEGEGFRIAMQGINGGRLNIGACSLGGGSVAMHRAADHLRARRAFGRALIDSQVLQFQLADMETELEAARSLLWRAAYALDSGAENAVRLCAMAKRVATDAGFEAANRALQMHGGYGYLAEYGIEKIVRDLRVHQILEGTNEVMRMIVARGLVAEPSPARAHGPRTAGGNL